MASEERMRREGEAFYVGHIRGRGRWRWNSTIEFQASSARTSGLQLPGELKKTCYSEQNMLRTHLSIGQSKFGTSYQLPSDAAEQKSSSKSPLNPWSSHGLPTDGKRSIFKQSLSSFYCNKSTMYLIYRRSINSFIQLGHSGHPQDTTTSLALTTTGWSVIHITAIVTGKGDWKIYSKQV